MIFKCHYVDLKFERSKSGDIFVKITKFIRSELERLQFRSQMIIAYFATFVFSNYCCFKIRVGGWRSVGGYCLRKPYSQESASPFTNDTTFASLAFSGTLAASSAMPIL